MSFIRLTSRAEKSRPDLLGRGVSVELLIAKHSFSLC